MTKSIVEPTAVLVSGGIDSFVAYHMLDRKHSKLIPVYFNLNTPYSDKEIKAVVELFPHVTIDLSLDLKDRQIGEKAYIPFRNLLLACQAVKYADSIVIAGIKDDQVSDKNEGIFVQFSTLLTQLEQRVINVWSPLWEYTKSDLVAWWYREIEKEYREDIRKTVSCYSPLDVSYCSTCPSCFRKWNAFWDNGIEFNFDNKKLMKEYLNAAIYNRYIPERNESIIKCVRAFLGPNKETIEVDIDGTLTKETEGYGKTAYKSRTPIPERIETISRLYKRGYKIVLRTSRHEKDRTVTERWLQKHGVYYDEIHFHKPFYHIKIDDKSFNAQNPDSWQILEAMMGGNSATPDE
jgi:7-cyano-7-deazaguanine synthase in queuosine biosynthesis